MPDTPHSIIEGEIYLLLAEAKEMKMASVSLVAEITEAGYDAIVITTNQPSPILRNLYKKAGIDPKSIWYIDAIRNGDRRHKHLKKDGREEGMHRS